jgi:hypothetical protein
MTTIHATSGALGRALRAKEAGSYLAHLIGRDCPFPATTMWRFARQNLVKTIRIGRLYYFRELDLREFVECGGCGIESHRRDV